MVDKPAGWTSHDVVARLRRVLSTRRVGHAGTLDPMATGVLVVGYNRGTKLLTYLVGCDKTYSATIRLGVTTVTDDAEGEVLTSAPADLVSAITHDAITAQARSLTGAIAQVPSAVSAIKVDGVRSYARVRSGESVALAARPVTVHRLEVGGVRRHPVPGGEVIDVDMVAEVSSGTYIRALARDLGSGLGVGGHLIALRRCAVGAFGEAEALSLADLTAEGGADLARHGALSLADAARRSMRWREVTVEQGAALSHGRLIDSPEPGRAGPTAAILADNRLIAILDESGPQARPRLVFG